MFESLSAYPHWFVVTCAALSAGVVLWMLLKVVKAALWMLFLGLLIIAAVAAASVFFK
jgi:hypothetical protein